MCSPGMRAGQGGSTMPSDERTYRTYRANRVRGGTGGSLINRGQNAYSKIYRQEDGSYGQGATAYTEDHQINLARGPLSFGAGAASPRYARQSGLWGFTTLSGQALRDQMQADLEELLPDDFVIKSGERGLSVTEKEMLQRRFMLSKEGENPFDPENARADEGVTPGYRRAIPEDIPEVVRKYGDTSYLEAAARRNYMPWRVEAQAEYDASVERNRSIYEERRLLREAARLRTAPRSRFDTA